jgi:hypothetical protein
MKTMINPQGNAIKAAAILALIDRYGSDIDKFVREITVDSRANDNRGEDVATKVVPILSVGKGNYAGAVQVMGSKSLVDTIRAVAQLEGEKRIFGSPIRARVLIPVSNRDVKDKLQLARVNGVGVSALIDMKV